MGDEHNDIVLEHLQHIRCVVDRLHVEVEGLHAQLVAVDKIMDSTLAQLARFPFDLINTDPRQPSTKVNAS